MSPTPIADNVRAITERVDNALDACGRARGSVTIIAVSKKQPAAAIDAARRAGLTHFGENYLQEAIAKIDEVDAAGVLTPPTWHFIGAVQTNKTRAIAEHFDWVHTVDRARVAHRLDAQTPPGKTLEICLQVNVDDAPGKHGVSPEQAEDLIYELDALARLHLCGLMTILDPASEPGRTYGTLTALRDRLQQRCRRPLPVLSMGMTGDFESAIAAGATHIRVGTGIFGPRSDGAPSTERSA